MLDKLKLNFENLSKIFVLECAETNTHILYLF